MIASPPVLAVESHITTLPAIEIEGQRPLPLGATILLVGDSLGVGMSHRFKELAVDCGYKPVTHVIGGTNTLQWHSWLKRDLDKHTPSLVLVVLGTNDAAQLDRMKTENAYGKLVSVLGDRRYLWILPHKIDTRRIPNIDATRDIIRSIASSHFDSSKTDVPLAPDKIHSSPVGYKTWMEAIWSHLAEEATIRSCLK